MQALEKILEEINQEKLKHWDSSERLDTDKLIGWCFDKCIDIIRKHMNDGWIPVEDERLWDILFEEACVEGEQAKRIYNRLKETFGGERSEMDGKF